jgi:hypothetical protein
MSVHNGHISLSVSDSFLQVEDVTFDLFPVDIPPFQSHRIVSNRFGCIHATFDLIFQVIESLSAYIGYYPNRSLLTPCLAHALGCFLSAFGENESHQTFL